MKEAGAGVQRKKFIGTINSWSDSRLGYPAMAKQSGPFPSSANRLMMQLHH
jgi:hypothetical protein